MLTLILALCLAAVLQTATTTPGHATTTGQPSGASTDVTQAANGWSLVVDNARGLAVRNGCSTISTGTTASFGAVEFSAVGGTTSSQLTIGARTWSVTAHRPFSTVVWLPLNSGTFTMCDTITALQAPVLRLLAHTAAPSTALPGGLINITARIPLPTSGNQQGTWALPDQSVPSRRPQECCFKCGRPRAERRR